MEGTQCQLGTRLADGLCRHDANGLADVHQLVGGQRPAIALGAHTALGIAGEHGTSLDLFHIVSDEIVEHVHGQCVASLVQHGFAVGRIDHVSCEQTGVRTTIGSLDKMQVALSVTLADLHRQAALGAAILFTHDHVLGDVHQTTGQVARLCGTQCGIGQTLTRAVLGDEVFQHGQAVAVVGLHRSRNDLALRVGHEASHACDLVDLHHVSSCTGLHDDGQVVLGVEVFLDSLGNLAGALGPQVDEFLTALLFGEHTDFVVLVNLVGFGFVLLDELVALGRLDDVGEREGHTGPRCTGEAHILQSVQRRSHLCGGVTGCDVVDDLAQTLLRSLIVYERVVDRQRAVEQDAAVGGCEKHGTIVEALFLHHRRAARFRIDDFDFARFPTLRKHEVFRKADKHLGLHVDLVLVERHFGLFERGEHTALALGTVDDGGQVVQTEDHVLARHGHGVAVCRLQNVVGSHHQGAGLGLGFGGQRQVDCHLVAIEVGVECGAGKRRQVDGLAFHQDRLERLNAQTVQRRCTVQKHRMLGDDLFEHAPHFGIATVHKTLGALHVLRVVEVHKTLDDERLEQFEGHRLRQTALVHAQGRTDHDHGTAGVVHTLTKQVLTETTLLALEHVAQGLQRAVRSAGDRAATTTVVEQGVDGFLKHALFVVEHDFRSAKLDQSLQTVVTVDHTTVEVVEIGGGETATVELHHRAQIRRNDRDHVEHHGFRLVAGGQEGVDDLQTLQGAGLALAGAGVDFLTQLLGSGLQIEVLQALLDGFGAHAAFEVVAVAVFHFAPQVDVAFHVARLQVLEAVEHGAQTLDLLVETDANRGHFTLGAVAQLGACGAPGFAFGLKFGQIGFDLLGTLFDFRVAAPLQVGDVVVELVLQTRKILVTLFLIDAGDHVGGEVDDLFQILRSDVQQVAQTGRNTLEEPDVGHRSGKLDMAHALTAHTALGDFHTAAFADDALEAHALVLAAGALPVTGRSEDLFAEQTVFLRLQGTVVNGFRLLDLAVAPITNVIGGGQANPQFVKCVDVQHSIVLSIDS